MTAETIPDTSTLLREGTNAARGGDKARARELLRLVTEADNGCEMAWLGLASVAETMAERVRNLERVLVINPENQQALTALAATKSTASIARALLESGAAAAKEGDRATAIKQFLQATEVEPQNETAWLWLASVVENPEDRLTSLRRVLAINPAHERAKQIFSQTKTQIARQLLQKSIAAFKRNDHLEASAILRNVMEYDENIEEGWLLMAYLSDSLTEKARHLKRVLAINPANERALRGLEWAESQLPAQAAFTAQATQEMEGEKERHLLDLSAAAWECPLCLTEASAATDECSACGAQLTLQDLDRLLGNDKADEQILRAALKRLRHALDEDPTARDLVRVGIALLNLKETDEGIAHLQAGFRLDPTDETLGMKVKELIGRRAAEAARFAEAEQRDRAKTAEQQSREDSELHEREESELRERQKREQRERAKCVLIVDDSPTVRKIVELKLGNRGYHVVSAVDGMDGLVKLGEQQPDLILLDVTMPRLDGYQLCKQIKSNVDTKHIPVVMLSGKDGFFDKVRGRMAGSTAYITKPFDPETLIRTVEEYCGTGAPAAK